MSERPNTVAGLSAKARTVSKIHKRLGATLIALHSKGAVRQVGFVDGLIGWRLIQS